MIYLLFLSIFMVKEIISLSFGEYSNYISTHFWNLNLELSKSKEHELANNVLYTDSGKPRALMFDTSENFKPYFTKNEKLEKANEVKILSEVKNSK